MGVRDPQIATFVDGVGVTGPPDRRIAALAARQLGVVHRSQLRALGLSDTAIRTRVNDRRLLRLHRATYAVGHQALLPEARLLAAALACGPGAALSHRSAAAHWGLLPSARARIDITAAARRGRRDPKIDLHCARRLDPADVTAHRGLPVTTVARTLVDLAGIVRPTTLERALNEAEVLRLYDRWALEEVLSRSPNRRGAQALRAALAEPAAMTRSEVERRFLELCAANGVPRPLVNNRVCGYEVDFLWPTERLVVETDHRATHGTRRAFERDRRKDVELMLRGYRVVRFTDTRVAGAPQATAQTVLALLAATG